WVAWRLSSPIFGRTGDRVGQASRLPPRASRPWSSFRGILATPSTSEGETPSRAGGTPAPLPTAPPDPPFVHCLTRRGIFGFKGRRAIPVNPRGHFQGRPG